jgi:hypothetical protein
MAKILVVIQGGIVQDVLCDGRCEVLIKDFDTEGCDPGQVYRDSFGSECYYRFPNVETCAPVTVDAEFEAATKQGCEA